MAYVCDGCGREFDIGYESDLGFVYCEPACGASAAQGAGRLYAVSDGMGNLMDHNAQNTNELERVSQVVRPSEVRDD